MSFVASSSSWLQTFRKLFQLAYGDQIVLEYESCRIRSAPLSAQTNSGSGDKPSN